MKFPRHLSVSNIKSSVFMRDRIRASILSRIRSMYQSRLNDHFAISPLLYDHRATWDSREGLDARSLHAEAAGSCLAEYRGTPIRSRFVVSVCMIVESIIVQPCIE